VRARAPTTVPTVSTAATTTTDIGTSTSTSTTVLAPLRVLALGDSTAEFLAGGLHQWANAQPSDVEVASLAQPGCGFVRDAAMFGDDDGHFGRDCARLLDTELPSTLVSQHPDLAVVMITLPDVLERTWSDDEGPLRPTDRRYQARLRVDADAAVATMLTAGVRHIVWVVGPPPSDRAVQNFVYSIGAADWDAYVQTVMSVAAAHPGRIDVVRLDRWMLEHEPADGSMRPDGVHLTPEAARLVADAVVGPAVLAAAMANAS
jgi:lysophospholipase L1-like esterase